MRVLITGSTGFIGSAVVASMKAQGHDVTRLVRKNVPTDTKTARWDPSAGTIDVAALEGTEWVVHLAGEGIGDRRWTEAHKKRVYESRVHGTGLLARTLAQLDPLPTAMVSASAMGYYGKRGAEILTEESSSGTGFIPDLCRQWENATAPAEEAGVRVAHIRNSLILGTEGGILGKMLLPFRLGLGAKLSSGRQYMSWATLADAVRAIQFLLETPDTAGPFNLTTPNPVTNLEFTKALGKALGRPALLTVPKAAIALVFTSEAADELVGSQRLSPEKLERAGFTFEYPELQGALDALLHKPAA